MFNTNVYYVLFLITIVCSQEFHNLSDMQVTNLLLSPCNAKSFNSISVQNLQVQISAKKRFVVSGTMTTTEDLTSPLAATVTLKKKIMFTWIKVPCEDNMGSCHYADLCSYGYPATKQCPPELVDNHIPCRCPFPRGNYTIPITEVEIFDDRSVLTGKYKGRIAINGTSKELACYNLSFALKKK